MDNHDVEQQHLAFITEEIRREDGPHDFKDDMRTTFPYPKTRGIWEDIGSGVPTSLFERGLNQGPAGKNMGVLGNLATSLYLQKGSIFEENDFARRVSFRPVGHPNSALSADFKPGSGRGGVIKTHGNYENKKLNFINSLFRARNGGIQLEREAFNEGVTRKSQLVPNFPEKIFPSDVGMDPELAQKQLSNHFIRFYDLFLEIYEGDTAAITTAANNMGDPDMGVIEDLLTKWWASAAANSTFLKGVGIYYIQFYTDDTNPHEDKKCNHTSHSPTIRVILSTVILCFSYNTTPNIIINTAKIGLIKDASPKSLNLTMESLSIHGKQTVSSCLIPTNIMDAGSGGATEESFWTCNLKKHDLDEIMRDVPGNRFPVYGLTEDECTAPRGGYGRDADLRTIIQEKVGDHAKVKIKLLSTLLEIKDAWRYFVYRPVRIPDFANYGDDENEHSAFLQGDPVERSKKQLWHTGKAWYFLVWLRYEGNSDQLKKVWNDGGDVEQDCLLLFKDKEESRNFSFNVARWGYNWGGHHNANEYTTDNQALFEKEVTRRILQSNLARLYKGHNYINNASIPDGWQNFLISSEKHLTIMMRGENKARETFPKLRKINAEYTRGPSVKYLTWIIYLIFTDKIMSEKGLWKFNSPNYVEAWAKAKVPPPPATKSMMSLLPILAVAYKIDGDAARRCSDTSLSDGKFTAWQNTGAENFLFNADKKVGKKELEFLCYIIKGHGDNEQARGAGIMNKNEPLTNIDLKTTDGYSQKKIVKEDRMPRLFCYLTCDRISWIQGAVGSGVVSIYDNNAPKAHLKVITSAHAKTLCANIWPKTFQNQNDVNKGFANISKKVRKHLTDYIIHYKLYKKIIAMTTSLKTALEQVPVIPPGHPFAVIMQRVFDKFIAKKVEADGYLNPIVSGGAAGTGVGAKESIQILYFLDALLSNPDTARQEIELNNDDVATADRVILNQLDATIITYNNNEFPANLDDVVGPPAAVQPPRWTMTPNLVPATFNYDVRASKINGAKEMTTDFNEFDANVNILIQDTKRRIANVKEYIYAPAIEKLFTIDMNNLTIEDIHSLNFIDDIRNNLRLMTDAGGDVELLVSSWFVLSMVIYNCFSFKTGKNFVRKKTRLKDGNNLKRYLRTACTKIETNVICNTHWAVRGRGGGGGPQLFWQPEEKEEDLGFVESLSRIIFEKLVNPTRQDQIKKINEIAKMFSVDDGSKKEILNNFYVIKLTPELEPNERNLFCEALWTAREAWVGGEDGREWGTWAERLRHSFKFSYMKRTRDELVNYIVDQADE